MIPLSSLTQWKTHAPWASDAHIEQDLLLSRILVEIFNDPFLSKQVAFRGGTALYKLFLLPAARYSEDIDLVQINPGPFGTCMSALRLLLDSWLGEPKRKQGEGRVTFIYKTETETEPKTPIRLKIEVNTREHFCVLGYRRQEFQIINPWFSGKASIVTYELEELLGTKLRALYQRKKGRDLFDLFYALNQKPDLDIAKVIACFQHYMKEGGTPLFQEEFLTNLDSKLEDPHFGEDIHSLLTIDRAHRKNILFSTIDAVTQIKEAFLYQLPKRHSLSFS